MSTVISSTDSPSILAPLRRYDVEYCAADGTTERITVEAPDNYTARTLALAEQTRRNVSGAPVSSARIRTGSRMFPGPWFDLNED